MTQMEVQKKRNVIMRRLNKEKLLASHELEKLGRKCHHPDVYKEKFVKALKKFRYKCPDCLNFYYVSR